MHYARPDPFLCTGREQDLEDLYYYRNRYYKPSAGRFISEDSIGLAGGSNLYTYVGNNPLRYTDPSGKCPWCLAGAIIGATMNTGVQLYNNGGNLSQIDAQQVSLAAAAGLLSGGLGTVTAGLGVAQNIAANSLGSGLISGAQQIANNALHGTCLTNGVGNSALKGAIYGGVGAAAGAATNAASNALAQQALNNLPLADRLLMMSNAISGPFYPPGTPNWAIGGTVAGNAISNTISNLNQ